MEITHAIEIETEAFHLLMAGSTISIEDLRRRHPGLTSDDASHVVRVALSRWAAAEAWLRLAPLHSYLVGSIFIDELARLVGRQR